MKSIVLYRIEMYAITGSTHLNKLETLNNKLLRILQNKPYNYLTRDLQYFINTRYAQISNITAGS